MTFQELEEKRLAFHKKTQKFVIPSIIILIFSILCFFVPFLAFYIPIDKQPVLVQKITSLSSNAITPILFITLFVIIIVGVLSCRKEYNAYKSAYKEYFVRTSLEKTFSDLVYHETSAIDAPAYGFIRRGDIYHSNDFVSGTYHGINFSQADVHIQDEYTDSDGDTHTVTVFRGRYMIFDFNRNFEDRMQIVSRKFRVARIKRSGKLFHKTKKHQVESTTFNENFKIYGEDGQEVFYILDPAFIDRIEKLYAELKCPIMLGFDNQKIHIAIDNHGDSFEPPSSGKPIDEAKEIAKVSHEISLITSFVDDLRLHNYTYKKA